MHAERSLSADSTWGVGCLLMVVDLEIVDVRLQLMLVRLDLMIVCLDLVGVRLEHLDACSEILERRHRQAPLNAC